MQKIFQAFALLFLASGCGMLGICKTDADCHALHADSFCYAGKNPKPGDSGVCTRKPGGSVDAPAGGSVDGLGGGSVDGPGGKSGVEAAAGLVISSFSPPEAAHGTKLHIQGKGFSAVPLENSVTFNGVAAAVVSAIPDEIVVEVPKNMLCTGPVRVTVDGKTATSTTDFTYVPTAVVSTVAGSGPTGYSNYGGGFAEGQGDVARFNEPYGIAIDTVGNLYVADAGNHRIRKISPGGVVSTFAGSGTNGHADAYFGTDAQFSSPVGITIDAADNLYVADYWNHRIRKVLSGGVIVSTIAGSGATGTGSMGGFIEGNGSESQFCEPEGIAIDVKTGDLYVADRENNRIRKISQGWSENWVSTFAGDGTKGSADRTGTAAQFEELHGIAIDAAGNLYAVDNTSIRKISPQGEVSTLVGPTFVDSSTGKETSFHSPHGIAIDTAGNLYVADYWHHCIRKVTSAGVVSTLAGNCGIIRSGFADGTGNVVQFDSPRGIAIDARTGNIYVSERYNHRIRKIVLE